MKLLSKNQTSTKRHPIVNSGKFKFTYLKRTGEITEQNNCFMAKTNLLPREITTTIVSQNPAPDHLIVV